MSIDKAEVLRYLGHRGQAYSERLDRLIDESIALCETLARPMHVLRLFDLGWAEGVPRLTCAGLALPGAGIAANLAGAGRCALLAATLGVEIEARIRVLEKTDLTASLVLDAAATDCIEKHCDQAERELQGQLAGQNLHPGARFSPGYGDLPLELQPDILRILDAQRRIGLTCTDRLILLPRKSVTAIIGLFNRPVASRRGCESCSMRGTCTFRRQGGGCNGPVPHQTTQELRSHAKAEHCRAHSTSPVGI